MIEEAARLETYLPLSYRTPKERDYIRFLWEAFDTDVEHGMLGGHKAINWWHRNVALAQWGYGLQGWKRGRIYPDFRFSVSGEAAARRIVALETTGARMECALILMEDIKAKLPAYLDALPARA